MSGPIALHGGGEFLPGDEPFLEAILTVAAAHADGRPVRALVIPVAAARQRPDIAAANGVRALKRVAEAIGADIEAASILVVDAASARDAGHADRIAAADLVHLPGGDPDLVPGILARTRTWDAMRAANEGGALIAGASAGAMGLAEVTWTPAGLREGLGLIRGFVVVPHFEQFDAQDRAADVAEVRARALAAIGLDERTGVLREAPGQWRVAGAGRATWIAADGRRILAAHGELLPIPA